MKLKINDEFFLKLIITSLFIFNYEFRAKFFPIIKDINILFFLSVLGIYYKHKFKINRLYFAGIIVLVLYNLAVNQVTSSPQGQVIYFNIGSILPLLLLGVNIEPDRKTFQEIVKFYNFFIYVLFIIFLIDLVSNNAISRFLASTLTTYPSNWMPSSSLGTRYRFYFAHPLYSSALVMVFYALNMIGFGENIDTKISYWPLHIITAILLLAFGSKTAIVVFVILFYIFNYTPKRLITGIVIVVALYFSGAMNYILYRFSTDTSLTSGRNESLKLFLPNINILRSIYTGAGEELQYSLTNLFGIAYSGAAQEYPILVYYLRYGMIFTFLIVFLQFISPLTKFFKKRNIRLVIFLCAIYFELNMFNGLTSLVDVGILYVITILIFKLVND